MARQIELTSVFLAYVFLLLPAMALHCWWVVKHGRQLAPKEQRFTTAIVVLLALLWLALEVAIVHDVPLLKAPQYWMESTVLAAGLLVVLAVAWRRSWLNLREEQRARMARFLPDRPRHWWLFVPLALLAGVGEEIAYRGVLFWLLREMLDSVPLALLLCCLAFGLSHAGYGLKGALGVAYFGFIFHVLYWLSGTLLVPMIVHAGYDLVACFGAVLVRPPEPALSDAAPAAALAD